MAISCTQRLYFPDEFLAKPSGFCASTYIYLQMLIHRFSVDRITIVRHAFSFWFAPYGHPKIVSVSKLLLPDLIPTENLAID